MFLLQIRKLLGLAYLRTNHRSGLTALQNVLCLMPWIRIKTMKLSHVQYVVNIASRMPTRFLPLLEKKMRQVSRRVETAKLHCGCDRSDLGRRRDWLALFANILCTYEAIAALDGYVESDHWSLYRTIISLECDGRMSGTTALPHSI